MDQVNFLMVPLELSRVVSALLHAMGGKYVRDQEKEEEEDDR